MIKKHFLVLTSLLFLSLAQNVFSHDGMGSIKVIINDFYTDAPVEGAQVLITPCNYTGTTNSNGEAIFEKVVPFRNYQVEVQADGYRDGAAGFVSVEAEVETTSYVPLKQKATITGHVTMQFLLIFRWPLRNATVKFQEIKDKSFVTIGEVHTNFLGRYSFDNLEEGTYRISAQAKGFNSEYVEREVKGGQGNIQNFCFKWVGRRDLNENESSYLKSDKSDQQFNYIPNMGKSILRSLERDDLETTNSAPTDFYSVPEAVPSVIPGPSELPYLYNDHQVLSSTSGSRFVESGATVYLRGFAVDQDLPFPQEFNPDAPCFDIYGNKNGNFSASIFSYSWTLQDGNAEDYTSLLNPSSTSENVSFVIPEDFQTGDYLVARLTVTDDHALESEPEEIIIMVAERVDEATCADCHSNNAAGYATTKHASVEGGAGCQDCHGFGSEHPDVGKMTASYWSGTCGQCHVEFAELQKNNHSDPLPFGYYEPEGELLTVCFPCHYTPGYIGAVESGKPFHEFHYGPDVLKEIPKDTPNVSCSVCHDPHPLGDEKPYGLRTGSAGKACDTCHYEKWQNAILEGLGGTFGNAYHYPEEDYTYFLGENNPHRTEVKCVLCHMDTRQSATDENGVLRIGGHTFRMRDYGVDNIPGTDDDILNITVCQDCHEELNDFDRNGIQTEVKELLTTLSNLLKGNNHGFLPANEPGNCARCHRGGTIPFLDDPENVLENAYTNYKLIINDRSRGIHNPGYIIKLLQDSINSIQNDYKPTTTNI